MFTKYRSFLTKDQLKFRPVLISVRGCGLDLALIMKKDYIHTAIIRLKNWYLFNENGAILSH